MKAVRQAVIDIGSNTVRLVVYAGLPRAPMPIYNEKSRVKLGACLAGDGEIDKATMKKALAALARFETLARAMQVDSMRVVATAATREAKNGHELVEKAAALGIRVDVLDGNAEATAADAEATRVHLAGLDGTNGEVGAVGGAGAARRSDPNAFDKVLGNRERTVLALVGQSLKDSEIAERLGISQSAVEKHIAKAVLFLAQWTRDR